MNVNDSSRDSPAASGSVDLDPTTAGGAPAPGSKRRRTALAWAGTWPPFRITAVAVTVSPVRACEGARVTRATVRSASVTRRLAVRRLLVSLLSRSVVAPSTTAMTVNVPGATPGTVNDLDTACEAPGARAPTAIAPSGMALVRGLPLEVPRYTPTSEGPAGPVPWFRTVTTAVTGSPARADAGVRVRPVLTTSGRGSPPAVRGDQAAMPSRATRTAALQGRPRRRKGRIRARMGCSLRKPFPGGSNPSSSSVTRLSGPSQHLTRGFASPPHDGFAFVGKRRPCSISMRFAKNPPLWYSSEVPRRASREQTRVPWPETASEAGG